MLVHLVYVNKGELFFLWKLHKETYFEYSESERGFKSAAISIEEIDRVVKELKMLK